MRTFRTRTTAAAATALLAALSLTACQNGDGSDLGAAPSALPSAAPSSPAADAPAPANSASPAGAKGGNGTSTGTGTGTGKDGSGTGDQAKPAAPAGKGGSADPASFAPCTGDNTRVTAVQPPRPINHLLITATNTGSRTCLAYAAPLLRFDDEQAAAQIIEGSKPQAVVTLAPGESAYASVVLSGERAPEEANGRVTQRLAVLFASRDASGSVGSPAVVKLPADTYKTDDAAVSYWQSTREDALTY
ncbi:DUF4232 domain-containing protein [Streptomyces roseolilacinus]|uniref:DUF4232 domain-containing protein n=1 Tax=Streptomyces roseolilacinus TaxID=66904 RepID=A0A918EJP0_9ACTN|nr:DUF4232 domain-containing protein [Streptomyces roseolilacinus]GGP92705.1 hypothetical protein GCM10010249_08510 [Streptomyces roseolilacinus]